MKKALMVFIVILCISSCTKEEIQSMGVLTISFKGRSVYQKVTNVTVDTVKGVNTLIKYSCTLSSNEKVCIFSDGYATYETGGIKSSNIVVSPDTTIEIKDGPLWEVHLKHAAFLYPSGGEIIIDGYFKHQ